MFKKNKKKTIFLFLILIIIFIISSNLNLTRNFLRSNISPDIKNSFKELFFSKEYLEEIYFFKKINYNQKILPKTQFENLDFKKIKINFIKDVNDQNKVKNNYTTMRPITNKFFISPIQNNLITVTSNGHIQMLKDYNFSSAQVIESNLKDFNTYDILDIEIIKNNLYISFVKKNNNDTECRQIQLVKATVDTKYLNFKNFFEIEKCQYGASAGRIVHYFLNEAEGILFTTGDDAKESNLAQDDNSLYGKILFIDFDMQNVKIISKGHRNPQGLLVDKEIILSTEHGPYGGDEINKIILKENYGWPISSYGESYGFDSKTLKDRNDYIFEKSHSDFQFVEPIYSFVPSIGISEIIKVPNNFSKYWRNNYLIASLNGRSLYRVSFDKNYSKIIYSEKIVIGERIRDIKYIQDINTFVLALEESGSIGLLKVQ